MGTLRQCHDRDRPAGDADTKPIRETRGGPVPPDVAALLPAPLPKVRRLGLEFGVSVDGEPLSSNPTIEKRVVFAGIDYRLTEKYSIGVGGALQHGAVDPYFAVNLSVGNLFR